MMTTDMDLRTAPPRRSAASAVLDPRFDGPLRGPQRPTPPSARRPAPRRTGRRLPGPAWRRSVAPLRLGAGVLAGAATMFVVALLDTVTGAQVPVLGSFAALPAPAGDQQIVSLTTPPATPGTCLSWTRADASDTRVVDCTQTHLFEQAGAVQLTDQKDLPDDGRWRQLVRERCDPVVRDYLGGKFDPDGRYRVGALKPSPAKWAQGDRELRCGLQSASRSGALYPMAGRAREQDQSAVHDPGTCLGIDGRTIGDPVDCAGPHAVEAVGVVDLGAKFNDKFPAVDAQDDFLQTECTKIATSYAGGDDVITAKKLTVYWDNVTEDSWKAGTRHVNCNLAALLPDRSGFAPVTGSVRGPVTVGDTPAPPAANTPEPGVPAQVPPVTPSPSPPATPTKDTKQPSTTPGPSGTDAPPLDGAPPPPPPPAPASTPADGPAPADPPEPADSPLPTPSVAPDLTSTLVGRGSSAAPLP
jgi:Septum formation